jgi:hypothetical protein
MAKPDLHLFIKDLRARAVAGSNAPPVSIRAKDLDENFEKVTVLPSEAESPEYRVEYRKNGVMLSEFLPRGENAGNILYYSGGWKITARPNSRGDLLFWDGSAWVVLPAASGPTLHVLTIQNGSLAWTPTEDCP